MLDFLSQYGRGLSSILEDCETEKDLETWEVWDCTEVLEDSEIGEDVPSDLDSVRSLSNTVSNWDIKLN